MRGYAPPPCEHGYTGDERDSCACPACEILLENRELLAELRGKEATLKVVTEHRDALLAENQRLREALTDEALMLEQSVKTLKEMRAGWRELIEEFEGGYLIEQYLDSLIEDLNPSAAREALAGDAE